MTKKTKAKIKVSIDTLSIQLEELSRLVQTRLVSENGNLNLTKFTIRQKDPSPYVKFLRSKKLNFDEHAILLLALIPHIRPDFFYHALKAYKPKDGALPQLGGVKDDSQQYFLPTGETAMFLLAGYNLSKRFEIQKIFSSKHLFAKEGILSLESLGNGNPNFGGKILLDQEYIDLFTLGEATIPSLSMRFPAQQITTKMEWEDLVLNKKTKQEIEEIKTWVDWNQKMLEGWEMERKFKAGYRVLFYGPSGTGKTLTAKIIGKHTVRKVFRIDLSMVVSKYIGETEKNLKKVFDKAHNKNWILFFDEADALFGKRTEVKDAHDRYANQEVSYLLQKVEDYSGLVILSSNFKNNIDDAFARRFNSIIHFPKPNASERLKLWTIAFPKKINRKEVDLEQLSEKFELTGANIMNVVHNACLQAYAKESKTINLEMIMNGIKKEFAKEGKLI